ncbi:MAG TPA: sigma-70 family RNA polymerase sigma factor [Planctomycetota bacterium]
MSPSRQPPEALLAHRQWVSDLASRLAGDEATAADVEQQTWLSAMRSPPRHASSLKAWLAAIVRNWVHKHHRTEARRTQRERTAAPTGQAPSTAEIVAEAEAHRRVVEAVFALSEPWKTTVLLRFFENLPLAEVAARTGVPLETAKSRVRRSLELLRASLDGGKGRTFVLAIAPLLKTGVMKAPPILLALETLIMSTKHKLIAATVLVLLAAVTLWTFGGPDPSPVVAGPSAATAAATPASSTAGTGDSQPAAAARTEERAERQLADARGAAVVRVLTWSGAPIEGASVSAVDPLTARPSEGDLAPEPTPAALATTDATGAVAFAELPAGRWNFLASKPGFCGAGRPDVLVGSGTRAQQVVIHLGLGHTLEGSVSDGRGPIAGAVVMAVPTSSSMVRPRTTTDARGRYRLETLASGPTYVAAARPGGLVSNVETIQVPEIGHLDLVLRTGGILTGVVTERETGRPVAGARVTASTAQTGSYRRGSASAFSDENGRYVIDALGEGLINEVTADKDGFVHLPDLTSGNFDTSIPFRDGRTWTRNVELGRGGSVTVLVLGPNGPVAGAKVGLRRPQPREREPVLTDALGRAEVAAVLPGRVLVEARADGLHQPGFPLDWWSVLSDATAQNRWIVEVCSGKQTSVEVALVDTAAVAGRVVGPDGQGLEGVLVKPAKALDARGAVTAADGSFRLSGMTPGATVALSLVREGWLAVGNPAATFPASGELGKLEPLPMRKAPRVRGTVRSGGAALGDAWVQVSMMPEREELWQEEFRWANTPKVPIGADGAYDAPIPAFEGRFGVRVVATRRTPVHSAPQALAAGQDTYRVDLELESGVALSGRVTALGGTDAVAGARIRATWLAPGVDASRIVRSGDSPVIAVSDGAGRFSITGLRAGRYELRGSAEGFLEETIEAEAPRGDLAVSLPPELSIEGHVLYEDGRPVPQAQIQPEPQQGNRAMSMSIEQVTFTGPDGRFKVPRVHAGHFRLWVLPPRTGLANFRSTQSDVIAAGAHDVRIVVVSGAVISGRVIGAQGEGLARIGVGARLPGAERGIGVQTLQDGSFTLIGLEDGASYSLTVNASRQNNRNSYASLQRHDVAAGTTGLEFTLEPGLAIKGTVVDGEGKPVSGLDVSASPAGADDGYGPVASIDQEGKFEIRGLKPGKHRLAVPQWFGRGVLLAGGDAVEAGAVDVQLTATDGAKLAGVVVDEAGAPVPGAEIHANAVSPARGGAWARTSSDGTFSISGLVPDASYDVSVRQRGRVPASRKGVASGSSSLRVELGKGLEVQGRLVDAAGRPQGHATLRFAAAAGGARTATRTDAEGRFAISGLVTGTYSVEASVATGGNVVARPCGTVEAGQRDVELRLRP